MSDRDPWDPPAEPFCGCKGHHTPGGCPVEPFPFEQPLLQEDEADLIREAFYDKPWEDPTRYQDCFRILYVAAASIASSYVPGREQHRATQALREVMQRVVHGEMETEVNRHG
jgi:hypothetical protein